MFCLSFLLGLSLWTASLSMRSHSVANAYIGFVSVIAMWSWHEMAFLTGWLTGPRRVVLDKGLKLRQRFIQSVQVLLYHELALLFNFGLLVAMQQGQPNHMALCTFALLWCMRLSAKLNLFFWCAFCRRAVFACALALHRQLFQASSHHMVFLHHHGGFVCGLGLDGVGSAKRSGLGQRRLGLIVFFAGSGHH
jgi:putative photosynthetic complex assembly protein 2